MNSVIYLLFSIFLSFFLNSSNDFNAPELLPPCSMNSSVLLSEGVDNSNYHSNSLIVFIQQNTFLNFINSTNSNNYRCWEGGGPEESCYIIGGCPSSGDQFCDGVCETQNGCTVCWICDGGYSDYH